MRGIPSSDTVGLSWNHDFTRSWGAVLTCQLQLFSCLCIEPCILPLTYASSLTVPSLSPSPAPCPSSVPVPPPPFPGPSQQGCAQCLHRARLADQTLPCREGSLKVGDRLLSIDGIPLHGASHTTALATLQQCSHEALFQVEYDVAISGKEGTWGLGLGRKRPSTEGRGSGTDPYHCKSCVTLGQSLSEPLWAIVLRIDNCLMHWRST